MRHPLISNPMPKPGLTMMPWRRWLLMLAIWTLIGLSFAGQFYISSSQLGRPITWRQALVYSLADWYVFAALSFIPLRAARLFSLEGERWAKHLGVHLGASVFFSISYVAIRALVVLWQGSPDGRILTLHETLPPLFLKTWHFNLLIYWAILSVAHALDYSRRLQERTVRTVELERSLAEAKLLALQMQLNPHFLFNSLHAITELMHRDVESADRMLTRLSELLRFSLDRSNTQIVTLQQELDFLRRYLEIEQTRFGDRLTVSFIFPPELLQAAVPRLILQPMVENAVKHGIEKVARAGKIHLSAARENDTLILIVEDNGKGIPEERLQRSGIGLSNTRARLAELYGTRFQFQLTNKPEGGAQARIAIPYTTNLPLSAARVTAHSVVATPSNAPYTPPK